MIVFRQNSASLSHDRVKRPSMWRGHGKRVEKALGLSMITLHCHEDTWKEIHRLMHRVAIWSVPQAIDYPSKPHVEIQLPGLKIAAALHEMRANAFMGNGFDRAFARRVYIALATVVDRSDASNPSEPLPPVVFDDTAGHDVG
jgi:hypothetical protein